MRCLSVLDLVILFYLFIFFLGREAQKVREWGVNSLKTSIFPLPTPLRGCRSLLEIVFLWDSVRCLSVLDLVILFYLFIFFLGREAQKVREWGVNSLKTSIFQLPTPLRGCRSLLEIVFLWDSVRCLSVLDLVILFYLFIFFLGREAQKVREWGVNSLKTSIFPLPTPLRGCRSLLEIVFLWDSVRCLSVLDLVILFYLFIFFLGREAQKVREWGVNSLKTSIFPLPTPLRGCRSLLEIVFLWDSVRCLSVLDLVILFYLFIFFLGREAQKVREWGVNSLKTSIFPLPTPLRGCRSLLEIVFL